MNFKLWSVVLLFPLVFLLTGWGDGQVRQRIRDRFMNRVSETREQNSAPAEASSNLEHFTMNFGGLARTYHVYRSKTQASPPLVIVLHGGRGSGQKFVQGTGGGLNQLADQEGFIVVYPDAYEGNWNDGRGIQDYPAQRDNIDDVGFLMAMINHFIEQDHVNPNRVYMAGVSNGAMMTNWFALEHADRLAAIATVIGSIPKNLADKAPTRPVPLLSINSTKDPLVLWQGGVLKIGMKDAGNTLPVPETLQRWVRWNHCNPNPSVSQEPDRDPQDGTRVQKEVFEPEPGGAEIVFYTVEGGGHAWPGSANSMGERFFGKTTHDISANQLISNFFRKH